MMRKSKFICGLCLVLVLLNSNIIYALDFPLEEPFFTLTLILNPNDPHSDYAPHVADYLADINIEVEIQEYEYDVIPPTLGTISCCIPWEMLFIEIVPEALDMRSFYTEEGHFNFFGLDRDIPYCNLSEQKQDLAVSAMDLEAREMLYNDWVRLFTDKILAVLPFFNFREYEALWTNTEGYDITWELTDSLPYMEYNGLHDGQESLDEFNIANSMWKELNPLFSRDDASDQIIDLISEPLITLSPYNSPLKTGIVHDWEQIAETHYRFYLRDDIFWSPSYNVTLNTDDSVPLENSPLMVGLKSELSNGINQQLTAKDAVFTLLTYANNLTNSNSEKYEWLSDCYVDEGDPLSFHIEIDENPQTPEAESYVDVFKRMSVPILPEFFLNSTLSNISYTEGGIKCIGIYPEINDTPQWENYSKSAFSCGMFQLYYSNENVISVLERNPNWFGVGSIDGTTGMQPFVERVNIKCIHEPTEALIEFKQGKLDLIDVTRYPEERKLMQADARFEVQTEMGETYSFLVFNLLKPYIGGPNNHIYLDTPGKEEYTKAVAIRKAICYAIDREEINQVEHDGEYFICHEPFPWPSWYYSEGWSSVKYSRNLESALEWMESAGYTIETDKANAMCAITLLIISVSIAYFSRYVRRKKSEI